MFTFPNEASQSIQLKIIQRFLEFVEYVHSKGYVIVEIDREDVVFFDDGLFLINRLDQFKKK